MPLNVTSEPNATVKRPAPKLLAVPAFRVTGRSSAPTVRLPLLPNISEFAVSNPGVSVDALCNVATELSDTVSVPTCSFVPIDTLGM